MSRTRIKFCGMTRPGDVRLACELGVDALGFVLVRQSPRGLALDQLESLRAAVPPLVEVIALFMDPGGDEVAEVEEDHKRVFKFLVKEIDNIYKGMRTQQGTQA